MPTYHKLYTPQDSAIVFIDMQAQMIFGVASMDRAALINHAPKIPLREEPGTPRRE